MAKQLLKDKFDNSEKFLVAYPVTKCCSNRDCRLRNINCHGVHDRVEIDLKKLYNTCTEEVGIDGFVADLLMSNSEKPELAPILLEVCVTHACEEEKVASGLQIIELKVKKEQDVVAMVGRDVLEELAFGYKKEQDVKFISFNREVEEPMVSDVMRYIFNPSVCENGYSTKIDCWRANSKMLMDSVCELNMVNTKNYLEPNQWHALEWMSRNKNVRRCNLCKFYYATMYEDKAICRLSKKYGKPKLPKMKDAETCRSYNPHRDSLLSELELGNLYIEEVMGIPESVKGGYRVIIAGSSSFNDKEMFWQKCNYYLGSKLKNHNVIILSGTAVQTSQFINEYASKQSLIVESHEADWERYGQEAGRRSNEEMLDKADALIAFWDGKGRTTGALIESAKLKGLKVAVVKY